MMKSNTQIIGNFADNLFIYFPFWFPIIYLGFIINFPQISSAIFIAALFLFAETHFATTWLFLFDSSNFKWIRKNLYLLFWQPVFFIILFIVFWNVNPNIVLILHYLASGWHVTNQSIGISKLSKNKNKIKLFSIYFFSFFCIFIGLIRPGLFAIQISTVYLNILPLILFTLYIFGIYFCLNKKVYLLHYNTRYKSLYHLL